MKIMLKHFIAPFNEMIPIIEEVLYGWYITDGEASWGFGNRGVLVGGIK